MIKISERKWISGKGTSWAKRIEDAPTKFIVDVDNSKQEKSDVVLDKLFFIAVFR